MQTTVLVQPESGELLLLWHLRPSSGTAGCGHQSPADRLLCRPAPDPKLETGELDHWLLSGHETEHVQACDAQLCRRTTQVGVLVEAGFRDPAHTPADDGIIDHAAAPDQCLEKCRVPAGRHAQWLSAHSPEAGRDLLLVDIFPERGPHFPSLVQP